MSARADRRTVVYPILGICLLLLLLTHTDVTIAGVKRGIGLVTNTLFPSLFPFLVLSELLVLLNAGGILGSILEKPFRLLFGISGSGATAFILGALCGFPTGAVSAIGLYENGQLSDTELKRLFLFIHNPSPGFLIGVVGSAMLGNSAAGAVLYAITTVSAVLIGIFLHLLRGPIRDIPPSRKTPQTVPDGADILSCIKRGFSTMLQISALVMSVSAITACLTHICQSMALPQHISTLLIGLLELTSGVNAAVTTLSPHAAFLFCAFFSGFSGISVCMQIFSVAENKGPRLMPYLAAKIAQGLLCLLFAGIYLKLFHPKLNLMQNASLPTGAIPQNSLRLFPAAMLLLLLCLGLCQKALRARTARKP